MADWGSLQRDLLGSILGRLPLVDNIRSGAVCTHWRSVVTENGFQCQKSPWLLPKGKRRRDFCRFYSIRDKREYKIRFPNKREYKIRDKSDIGKYKWFSN